MPANPAYTYFEECLKGEAGEGQRPAHTFLIRTSPRTRFLTQTFPAYAYFVRRIAVCVAGGQRRSWRNAVRRFREPLYASAGVGVRSA